jgi:hypothetical protein
MSATASLTALGVTADDGGMPDRAGQFHACCRPKDLFVWSKRTPGSSTPLAAVNRIQASEEDN